jgi:hypothetical protein
MNKMALKAIFVVLIAAFTLANFSISANAKDGFGLTQDAKAKISQLIKIVDQNIIATSDKDGNLVFLCDSEAMATDLETDLVKAVVAESIAATPAENLEDLVKLIRELDNLTNSYPSKDVADCLESAL